MTSAPRRRSSALIPVRLESGIVVMHTREEYQRLWEGVDREAAEAMVAPIEVDDA